MRGLPAAAALFLPLWLAACVTTAESSKDYQALLTRGETELANKNFAAARSTFREMLDRFPQGSSNQDVRLFLADCEFELGNEPVARKLREQVARETTSNEIRVRALSGLGMQEITRENFEVAARDFEEAAKLEPDPRSRAVLIARRGLALQRSGRFAEAREAYRQALAMAPGSKGEELVKAQLALPDYFFVQAGAFRTEANAERQRQALAQKGFPAEVVPIEAAGVRLYRVRVGRFPDRASARAEAQKLRDAKLVLEKDLHVRP